MRIVNLVENTEGAPGCGAAHGLSFYIETAGGRRLLMDTGPSDLLAGNAAALGVDLVRVDTVVLSHGHYDHSDGLPALHTINPRARIYLRQNAAADYCADDGDGRGMHYIGIDRAIPTFPGLIWVEGDLRIDDELQLFTNIRGRKLWPEGNARLMRRVNGACVQDDFSHEQCLVITEGSWQVLLSGCAHNGILNILDRCVEVTGRAPDAVISGFHMMKRTPYTERERATIADTARELTRWPCAFHTGHCTGLPAYEIMKEIMGDQLHYVHCGEAVEL